MVDRIAGQNKEAEIIRTPPIIKPTRDDVRHGIVSERVLHITLKSIAKNAEIDLIWEKWQAKREPLRAVLSKAVGRNWED